MDHQDRSVIKIGSRESRLAVIQAEIVAEAIRLALPEAEVELVTMKTTGDLILNRPLDEIGGKGLFVKELDLALMERRCDLSVHSLKDMPMEVPKDLPLLAYTEREDARDVLVLREGLAALPPHPVIGTGSKRRQLQAAVLYPDAEFKGIRGNLSTRLKKLDEGGYDALILAAAGLKRQGFGDRIARFFSTEEMIPSAGQGILAVQGRREPGYEYLESVNDRESQVAAIAERAFVRTLDGGCSLPTAAYAQVGGGMLRLRGLYYNEETRQCLTGVLEGNVSEAEQLGIRLALRLSGGWEAGESGGKANPGTVWLVGAGPGNAGLFTKKGEQVLKNAQVVVYDALVGDEILGMIPDEAEQIYVGKRSGCHAKTQEEIGEILVEAAGRADRVVRLKGGDPYVFGRGSEEAALLKLRGIPFEVVPGVTSAAAVPAYCGIPLTHRGIASSFHVITGHGKGGQPVSIDYDALARQGGTLVFLMGVRAAKEICEGLMNAGMDPGTPAAFLQEGTTAGQKKVISDLAHLAEDGKKNGICPPAIFVVGAVCLMEESCRFAELMPLFGKKVLVTRPGRRASVMAEKLRSAGAEAVELPAIRTCLIPENRALKEALVQIGSYQWLAFTSPAGVELFLSYIKEQGQDIRRLAGLKIAVIGNGTAEVLKQAGIFPDYLPERFYAADLGRGLAETVERGEKLLILRAREGSKELIKPLAEAGIQFDDVPLYETVYPKQHPQAARMRERLAEKKFDFVTFTSGSTVEGFMRLLQPDREALTGFTAVCIGERTREAAEKYGMHCIMSRLPSMDSMVECMVEYRRTASHRLPPVSSGK